MKKTVGEIAAFVGGSVVGDASIEIGGVAGLEGAAPGDIAFIDSAKYAAQAMTSRASAVIVPEGHMLEGKTVIQVKHPRRAFAQVVMLFHPPRRPPVGIHPTAVIGDNVALPESASVGPYVVIEDDVRIGERVIIGAGVFIGSRSTIGDDTIIHPHVTIYHDVTIGARVTIHAGSVIGGDGFGYFLVEGTYHKFPQIGSVIIEDDVEIGTNVTIDRGTLGATIIGRGTKIDNLVQVAHNVIIGEDTVIAAQTGIAGSSHIEDHVVIGGQVGIADHVRIGRGAVLGAQAGIPTGKRIPPGEFVWGTPARAMREFKSQYAHLVRLPRLAAQVEELARQVAELKKNAKGQRPTS